MLKLYSQLHRCVWEPSCETTQNFTAFNFHRLIITQHCSHIRHYKKPRIKHFQSLKQNSKSCLKRKSIEVFRNSRLIRQSQQNKIYKKFKDLTRIWTRITSLTVRHLKHYTRMFSVPVWSYNWILFMCRWFCPVRLIHLIGRKSLHFEKKLAYHAREVYDEKKDSNSCSETILFDKNA